MIWTLDEAKCEHLFVCLTVGAKEYKKQLKGAETLKLPTARIEAELELNRQMRRELNPGAVDDEDEARDNAQIDIEDEIEGATETGGSTRTRIQTPPAMTDEQIRDALVDIGLSVPLVAVRALEPDARRLVEEWLGQAVAAHTVGGVMPEEPVWVSAFTVPNEIVDERYDAGPYIVIEAVSDDEETSSFEIVHSETKDVKESLADEEDAYFFAAQLNVERLRNSEMSDADVTEWAAKGPWSPVNHGDNDNARWMIEAGTQTERCDSQEDAFGRAARYNKSIADRAWTEEKPVRVDDEGLQQIKAAEEAGELETADEAPLPH